LGKSVGYKEEEPEDLWQDIHWQFLRCLYSIDLSPNEREIVFRLFFRVKDSIRDGIRKRKRDNLRRILSDPVDLDSIISPECILDASDISISARLSLYLRNGILKLIEYEIIKSFLGGSETLVECADRLGIDYETAKKIRQRAIKKIRHLDVFLSPFGTVAPPYIGGRRKYDRDSDDEDSY
jgi:DNA-binding CsgD family transcriptional regulator